MNTIEETNKIFRAEWINMSLNVFWLFLRLAGLAFLINYLLGNRFVYKNNEVRQRFSFIKYIKIVSIISLILAMISLISAFAIYSEVDS